MPIISSLTRPTPQIETPIRARLKTVVVRRNIKATLRGYQQKRLEKKGKTVERGRPEQPGKPKAAEEAKPEKKDKTVERGRPEQPGKAEAEGKPKQGKKAAKEGQGERPGQGGPPL